MRPFLILVLGLGFTAKAYAQSPMNWSPRTDLNGRLPAGIQVFEDKTIPAWYAQIDLKDTTQYVLKTLISQVGGEAVSSFAAANKSYIAINGGYFSGGNTFSLVAQNGLVLAPNIKQVNRGGIPFYPTRSAFGLLKDGKPDIAWVYEVNGKTYAYPAPSPNKQDQPQTAPSEVFPAGGAVWEVQNGIGGGPVLVQEGKIKVTWEEEVFFGSGVASSVQDPRTALGYTADQKLILMVVDGRSFGRGASLPEVAKWMVDLGAVEAMNLDGGGSSTMVVGTTLVNKPSDGAERKVATALVLMPKLQKEPPHKTEYIFDTGDACCYVERGAQKWFESANTPFYGSTKARLNEAGTGTDRGVFFLKDLPQGTYELSAWWLPAANRATNTPFNICNKGVCTIQTADQSLTSTAGKWNILGTFKFAAGDSVLVSDQAKGNTSPSYVCVDALKLTLKTGTAHDDNTPHRTNLLHLFPNPSNGLVNLQFETAQTAMIEIEIFDVLGRRLQKWQEVAQHVFSKVLNLQGQSKGLYFVRVTDGQRVEMKAVLLR